jgi:hypothetical protein
MTDDLRNDEVELVESPELEVENDIDVVLVKDKAPRATHLSRHCNVSSALYFNLLYLLRL